VTTAAGDSGYQDGMARDYGESKVTLSQIRPGSILA
jgi:hypothetical protein